MRRTSRGLTVLELLILASMLGVIVVGGLIAYSRYGAGTLTGEGSVFDSEEAAKAWARKLDYTVVAATCMNVPSNGYVRCTVRVEEQPEPIALECGIVTKGCSVMRMGPSR